MKGIAAAFAPLLLCVALLAQAQQAPVDPIDEFYRQLYAQPDEFGRFLFLHQYDTGGDDALQYEVDQMLATEFSFFGRPNDADRVMPFWEDVPDGFVMPDRQHYAVVPALDWITAKARNRQAVMINEAHHRSGTRRLTLVLLPRLRALGFTHLALETLDAGDTELTQRGYPVYDRTGYYSGEPIYGEIIREALRLGFVVVPYESAGIPGQTQQQRETRQAENLIARVFANNPNAKLLVHAGYAHIDKALGGFGPRTRPMAMEFQRLSGIEPLSIQQALMVPAPAGLPPSVADRIAAEFDLKRPSVLLSHADRREWTLRPGLNDLTVVFPTTDVGVVRPAWMSLNKSRVAIDLSNDLQGCLTRLPCALEARYQGESADAVPADQLVVLTAAERAVPLYLKPARYELKVRDNSGQVVVQRALHVCAHAAAADCARAADSP